MLHVATSSCLQLPPVTSPPPRTQSPSRRTALVRGAQTSRPPGWAFAFTPPGQAPILLPPCYSPVRPDCSNGGRRDASLSVWRIYGSEGVRLKAALFFTCTISPPKYTRLNMPLILLVGKYLEANCKKSIKCHERSQPRCNFNLTNVL